MSERYTPSPEEQQLRRTKISRRQFVKHIAAASAMVTGQGSAIDASSQENTLPNPEEFVDKVVDKNSPESQPTPTETPLSLDEFKDMLSQALEDEDQKQQEESQTLNDEGLNLENVGQTSNDDAVKIAVQQEGQLPNININQEWVANNTEAFQFTLAVTSAVIEKIRAESFKMSEFKYATPNRITGHPDWLQRHRSRDKSTVFPKIEISKTAQSIMELPAESKQTALDILRGAYLDKIHNQGLLYNEMLEIIKTQPDINEEELRKHLYSEAIRLGFNREQFDIGVYIIGKFAKHRNEIEEVIALKEAPEELFERLTGSPPEGQIEVEYLYPFCIDIKPHSPTDYARLHMTNIHNPIPQEVTSQDIQNAESTIGFYPSSSIYTVTRIYDREGQQSVQSTQEHERQHAINEVVRSLFNITNVKRQEKRLLTETHLLQALNSTTSPDAIVSFSKYLNQNLKLLRQMYIDPQAKDEIIAQYRGVDRYNSAELYATMVQYYPVQKYITEDTRGDIENSVTQFSEITLQHPTSPDSQALEKIGQGVKYDSIYTEYDKLMYANSLIIKGLEELGYQKDEIISILSVEDLHRWPALFRRLISVLVDNELERKYKLNRIKL